MNKTKTTTIPQILIIAPRHYVEELQANYANQRVEITYYHEETIHTVGLASFIENVQEKYDGYIGLVDYSSLVASHLNGLNKNPSPRPGVLAGLQDKYVSRKIQQKAGLYEGFYATAKHTEHTHQSDFPLFAKPRRASMSYMAQRIDSKQQLEALCNEETKQTLLAKNKYWAELYSYLGISEQLQSGVDDFVVESLLPHGLQVTLDGYVQKGKVGYFGFTKSVFQNNRISFKRFDFPYVFSRKLDKKIRKHAKRLIKKSGFNNSLFNIEYKVDVSTNRFALVEINTRPSSQFMYPIELVTGVNPLDYAIEIVLGKKIDSTPKPVKHRMCSVCVLRRQTDAVVAKVPTKTAMKWLEDMYPGARWKSYAVRGEALSEHPNDSFSYRYAEVVVPHTDEVLVHDYEKHIESKLLHEFELRDVK